MDNTDEPQKKIFKARKTMKVSDRQQLEVVYKVKEDFKLMNGRHENGDSDVSSLNDTDCMEDKKEETGRLDICVDPNNLNVNPKDLLFGTLSETMENRRDSQATDLGSATEPLPVQEMICEEGDPSNVISMDTNGQVFEQNKALTFNAGDGTKAQGIDQQEIKGSSFSVNELSCEKHSVEEHMDEGVSVHSTDLLSDQSVEELALTKQPKHSGTAEKSMREELMIEDQVLVEARPENRINMSVTDQPLEELSPAEGKQAAGPLHMEKVVEPQDLLKDLQDGLFAEDLQQDAEILAQPQLDLVPVEIEMAFEGETHLEEKQMDEPQLKETEQQELVKPLLPEMGTVELPQLIGGLIQEPQFEAGLVKPSSEEELTEDQLLEELAEEQQFEDLAEDNLLDELVEEQPSANVLEKCDAANSVVEDVAKVMEEKVVREEGKFEVLETTEGKSLVGKINEDLEPVRAVPVETQGMEEAVEEQEAKEDLEKKGEEQQVLMENIEVECSLDLGEKVDEIDESKVLQEETSVELAGVVEDAGEAAISSSMEIDQESNVAKMDLPEITLLMPPADVLNNGSNLGNSDSMETDDIIPILEKLAPVEDRLNSFSKPPVLSELDPNPALEAKVELSRSSLPKQEHSDLPSEAFLVLSDEEDTCVEEVAVSIVHQKQSSPTEKEVLSGEAEKEMDSKMEEPNKEDILPERNEASRRKRSQSEEMDSAQFKRCRYEGEDYEAELEVKITARADVDQKLQKVIQRLLEEKLCVLQCAVFDRTLADLKTRVEKIECKKHESVLNGIQAKIARLSKRFGAAKEDLKKRQETQAMQPVQPVQTESPGKAVFEGANNLVPRNVCTVRQILDSKRSGETPVPTFQAPASAAAPPPLLTQPPPLHAAPNQPLQRIAPTLCSQSPVSVSTPARPMPDWKLIQQRINATHIAPPPPKPQTPVTSTQVMAPVLSSPTTATVVGTSQVPGGSGTPMSVSLQSLQSLPVILHVPVMQSTMQNATVMQSTTGTLVTNQQSGNMEFIPSQNQGNVGTLNKTPVSLAPTITTKPNNSPSLPSPTMQRTSLASAASSGPTLSMHAVSTAHTVAQAARTSLPTVSTSGPYTTTISRAPLQMKVPISSFSSPTSAEPPATPRAEVQHNRAPASEATVAKRAAESTTQVGKPGSGVIDLTLDDDEHHSNQDGRKPNPVNLSGISHPPQILPRPPPPPQTSLVQQNTLPAGLPTQTTIHVLPTAQTTVNVNHRPMTQAMPRLSGPRTPTSHQVVYTLPSTPIQSPVRNAVMQGQTPGLRQIGPQTGGMTVRIPQTTAYLVNNGMAIGSGGPQLTVHHRPPQEPVRIIHPAPLPEAPQPQRLPPEAASTSPPQKPHLKLARVQSQNGIVLSWSVLEVDRSCASVDSYHLYAYHEDPTASTPSQWKKIGEVKALPLPMACTLTQFVSGSKYYFAVRAKDVYGRFGVFCDPQSTDVIATQTS